MLPFSNSPSLWETTTSALATYTLKIGNQVSVAKVVAYGIDIDKLRLETSQRKKKVHPTLFCSGPITMLHHQKEL